MIGIYKITNKLTGKSYIGQSIDCTRRFEEHYKGNTQLIDQIIQIDGIENFTYEILELVDKEHLSEREDYYIAKYNTMYPNGYNRRWNTSNTSLRVCTPVQKVKIDNDFKIQENIERPIYKHVSDDNGFNIQENIKQPIYKCVNDDDRFIRRVHVETENSKQKYKLSAKSWLLYYYLMIVSNFSLSVSDTHRFVMKDQLNVSEIAKIIDVSRATIYNNISKLEKAQLLINKDDKYLLSSTEDYVDIDVRILRFLLNKTIEGAASGAGDILRIYLILSFIDDDESNYCSMFMKSHLVKMLGHSKKDNQSYKNVEKCLSILMDENILELSTQGKSLFGNNCTTYKIESICRTYQEEIFKDTMLSYYR